jgi:catechol 2,3-dioxygenase-like lactoylglutathione lyase family enzyme
MVKAIGHVAYNVADMDKSIHFFCDILGFKHAFSIKDDKGEPWIEYIKIRDGQFVELFYAKKEIVSPAGASYNHLCLEVDFINEINDRLMANGVDVYAKPKQGADLNYQCWARDPDGNPIEFMQIHPDSPQMKS